MRTIDATLLRTFVTVAGRGSMTAAANALHLTQGAVSQQVRRLEETFGCLLFERDRRGLRLTAAGERLLGKAERMLGLNDEIWAAMTAPADGGSLRLGVPYDLVGTLLPPALKSFVQSFPRVEVELVLDSSPNLCEAVAGGRVDLALVEQPAEQAAELAEGDRLGVDRLVWVGARNGTAHRRRPLPLSIVSESCAFRPAVFSALGAQGMEWRTVFENGSVEATRATVGMDLAVTVGLAATVPPELAVLPADSGLPALPRFAVVLRAPRTGTSVAAQNMIRHLRLVFPERGHRAA